jgi:hypothetical protein
MYYALTQPILVLFSIYNVLKILLVVLTLCVGATRVETEPNTESTLDPRVSVALTVHAQQTTRDSVKP